MKTFREFVDISESCQQLNELVGLPRVPGLRTPAQRRTDATNQRAQLGVVKTNRGYVAQPGPTSYDPEKGSQAIKLANRLNKETGLDRLNKPRQPSGDDATSSRPPRPSTDTSSPRPASGPPVSRAPVASAPKPPEKTYDVGGKQMTKSAINTEYERLRKTDSKAAVSFGKTANQSIYNWK